MCGIAGFWTLAPSNDLDVPLLRALQELHHRGPDDGGTWVDEDLGIALGHRRLAIVDLSPLGAQPMASGSGRYQIVFNGEIYNFAALRAELEGRGIRFRGQSDTEVILSACEVWGIDDAVRRFVGMFAFAVWDRQEATLVLGRDRLGEKPLYYGWIGESFAFASELKALKALPGWKGTIDRQALAGFLRHGYVPGTNAIFSGIRRLEPGTMLTMRLNDHQERTTPKPSSYWSAREIAEAGQARTFQGTDEEAISKLDELLREAVRLQMVADVPLGAFLSGGIDSSTIVAMMQAQSGTPVQTFSIGFHEAGYDEAVYAREVARHLGTSHSELYVTPREALDVIPLLPRLYDEPFSDSSQIPTFLVSQLARKKVTVSLSGDAGDELFGGYARYDVIQKNWERLTRIPGAVRRSTGAAIEAVPQVLWGGQVERVSKVASILTSTQPEGLYHRHFCHWARSEDVVLGATEPQSVLNDSSRWANLESTVHRMMFLDLIGYLPDDILVKVDRAAMGVSLETRVPLLDHRVVEFAWSLPVDMKVRDKESKWILRQVLDRYVPRRLFDRPKMGFGVPIGDWLRGPLRGWAEELLSESRLRRDGILSPGPIRTKWAEHVTGTRNWQYLLWDVLMFQAWLDSQTGSPIA